MPSLENLLGKQVTKKMLRKASQFFSVEEINSFLEKHHIKIGSTHVSQDYFNQYLETGINPEIFIKLCNRLNTSQKELSELLINLGLVEITNNRFIPKEQLIRHELYKDEWINQVYDLLCLYDYREVVDLFSHATKLKRAGPLDTFLNFKERNMFEFVAWINYLSIKDKVNVSKPPRQLFNKLFSICSDHFPDVLVLDADCLDMLNGLYKKANLGELKPQELELLDFFEEYHGRPYFYYYLIRNVPEFRDHVKDCIKCINIESLKDLDKHLRVVEKAFDTHVAIINEQIFKKIIKGIQEKKGYCLFNLLTITEKAIKEKKLEQVIPAPLMPFFFELVKDNSLSDADYMLEALSEVDDVDLKQEIILEAIELSSNPETREYIISRGSTNCNRSLFIINYFLKQIDNHLGDYNLEMDLRDEEDKLTGFVFERSIKALLKETSKYSKHHFNLIESNIILRDPELLDIIYRQGQTEIDLLTINHEKGYVMLIECHNYLRDNTDKTMDDALKIAYTADYLRSQVTTSNYTFKDITIPKGYKIVPIVLCNKVNPKINKGLKEVLGDMAPIMVYTGMLHDYEFMKYVEAFLEGNEAYEAWLKGYELIISA